MRIDIITVLPEMLEGFFNCSIMSRAQKKGIAEFHIHNLRDYTFDRYRKVDDYPFGGCAGMVMKIEPIDRCISALKAERDYDEVIFTSPDGEQFDQKMANTLSMTQNLIILCGHFKGIPMNNQHYQILFKIIYWLLLYIHVLQITRDGKCPTFCFRVMRRKYANGSSSNRWNGPSVYVPTC